MACVETVSSPIPCLSDEQYQVFVKHFREEAKVTNIEASPTVNVVGRIEYHNGWLIDSGATKHITHRSDFLENKVTKSTEAPVIIRNGETVPVFGKGEHTLLGEVKIKGVLYVVGHEGLDWNR